MSTEERPPTGQEHAKKRVAKVKKMLGVLGQKGVHSYDHFDETGETVVVIYLDDLSIEDAEKLRDLTRAVWETYIK